MIEDHISNDSYKKSLFDVFVKGRNPSLRYHNNIETVNNLVDVIISSIESQCNKLFVLDIISTLAFLYDYRYGAEYLWAIKTNNKEILDILEKLAGCKKHDKYKELIDKFFIFKFKDRVAAVRPVDVFFVSSLHEVFTNVDKHDILIYVRDSIYKADLVALLNDVGLNFGEFVAQHYDIPGLNAVVRAGVVKHIVLPKGRVVVCKTSGANIKKFKREQDNYEAIIRRVGQNFKIELQSDNSCERVFLRIVFPVAVIRDNCTQSFFAFSPFLDGVSLEDLVINTTEPLIRTNYLKHYKLILNTLYDYGIIWGDMCLRNILVVKEGNTINYYIFDFEKTTIIDSKVSKEKQNEHCRGQIFAEELCTLCTIHEIEQIFKDQFYPSIWDLNSKEFISFRKRKEVIDIFGKHNINTLGDYNTKDMEIIRAREIYMDRTTNKYKFPGLLGFKIEHYLSCLGYLDAKKYEDKLTEILIFSMNYNCRAKIVNFIEKLVNKLEGSFLETEFYNIMNGREITINSEYSYHIAKNLMEIINTFHMARYHKEIFEALLKN